MKRMIRFRDLSLKTKLIAVSMLTWIPVFILFSLFIIINERTAFRKELVYNISTLAEVVGINSTAALVFNDPKTAEEILGALSAEPNIVAAGILDQKGGMFAAYVKPAEGQSAAAETGCLHLKPFVAADTAEEMHLFMEGDLVLVRPVLFREAPVGQVYIRACLAGFNRKLVWYIAIVLGGVSVSVFLASFLSSALNRLISRPVMQLAEKVSIVSEKGVYSIRADKFGEDEIGKLIDGFNEMLSQIEKRDAELAVHRDNLEEQVAGRTAALAEAIEQLQTEISERRRTQNALRQSEKRYREMFENMINGVVIFRGTGREREFILTDMNKAAERIAQIARKQAVGKRMDEIFPALMQDQFIERMVSVWEKGLAEHLPPTLYDDGRIIVWIEAFSYKLPAGDVVVIFSDETERVQNEMEKKKIEARLLRAQKMEALGTLAGGVAHDLNNILSGIMSYPELLLYGLEKNHPMRKPLQTIQKSGHRAAAIVQDLLTLARRGVSVKETVVLNDVISDYLKSPEHEKLLAYHPNIKIESKMAADTFKVTGSPVHISKTMMNLMSNALEAMPDGGTVSISLSNAYVDTPLPGYDAVEPGNFAVLKVSDEGIGISPSDLERIFEPFYTKKVMGRSGTGLGMAVVWGTMKDLNGCIDVKSKIGKGTVFTLYFPASEDQESDLQSEESRRPLPKGGGKTVLVVDDVKEQREIACSMLQSLGYKTESVKSGEAAVAYIHQNQTDLLLLDMIMDPGIDGYETYRRILNISPAQKAVVASGFSESERVRMTQALGAGAYVKKPYTLEEIAVAANNELRKKNGT